MEPFIGEIRLMGFPFAPRGWAYCQGQLLPISTNQALFSLLGTQYGGNGIQTFGLPDLRGRVMLGAGAAPGMSTYTTGQSGGTESVTLQPTEMPKHEHPFAGSVMTGDQADSTTANGTYPATSGTNQYSAGAANASLGTSAVVGGTTAVGGNQPHENRQPLMAMNYAIALSGIFPSRG